MVMQIAAMLFLDQRARRRVLAPNVWDAVVFRIIGGLGVGIASVIAPAYIAEIAPASLRGRLGSLQQLAIVTGIFISLLVDYIFAHGRRRLDRDRVVRLRGLALDVPRDGRPGHRLRRAGADHPRVAALPDRQAPDPRGRRRS